ncbi:hypothetical protein COS12_00840 [Candidatus Roizmanbacteria bacterium CG01_land_8_20_14_3_00_33_9]|uniref:Type II secretion system protein n=5 Tax=Candidatus Roizmaniibacteriota TaxID=1752723 RepID=A0A2M7E559_9BACT|nr:MAG: hypothetical protein COS12_00840 [Candidatus Roizmanbacteria bacterium CG01_land_8_20_14_3_00_33_9]
MSLRVKRSNPVNLRRHVSIISFTLIEVLIFSAIVSTFFVSAAAITTFLLRSMKVNEHKIIATRYAEELLEWVRATKEKDWNNSITGCFNVSPVLSTGCVADVKILTDPLLLGEAPNKIYNRKSIQIGMVQTPDGEIVQKTIKVIVEWAEGQNTQSVTLDTIIAIWER